LTVTADAPPVMVSPGSIGCLIDMKADWFAAILTPSSIETPPRAMVNIAVLAALFVTMMSVTVELKIAGTVYRTVVSVVVAAPRKKFLEVIVIYIAPMIIRVSRSLVGLKP
jgi:hypothetical protein